MKYENHKGGHMRKLILVVFAGANIQVASQTVEAVDAHVLSDHDVRRSCAVNEELAYAKRHNISCDVLQRASFKAATSDSISADALEKCINVDKQLRLISGGSDYRNWRMIASCLHGDGFTRNLVNGGR